MLSRLAKKVLLAALTLSISAQAQELSFRRAVELSLAHSGLMALAAADQARAHESYLEARNAFLPQMTLGSGLAYTYGYPLSIEGSAPSIIDFDNRQALINPAQKQFIAAAHREWDASTYLAQDRKNAVILETALDYDQLDATTSMLNILKQQLDAALRAQEITSQRVRAGVDSEVTLTRAKLAAAKAQVKQAELEGDADLLRARLSQLTGLRPGEIQTQSESIPKLPEIDQQSDLTATALSSNPQVKQAELDAISKEDTAKGYHRGEWPAVDFVATYGLFSKANNFQKFFSRFQRNNATVGVAIRFPFLNFAGRSHAAAADLEAVAAKAGAQGIKDQVTNDTLRLQRSLRQFAAAKEVARLEYELAHADTEAAQARVQSGNASVKDQEAAFVSEQESFLALLQATFDLDRAEMQLLRQTDQIQQWALGGP
jgi:outer membrane protein TolC